MASAKDQLLSRLLQPSDNSAPGKASSSLIQEIAPQGEPSSIPVQSVPVPSPAVEEKQAHKVDEGGPSILELMMEAQRSAKAEKDAAASKEAAAETTKDMGKGFKKGFFGSKAPSKTKPSNVDPKTVSSNVNIESSIVEVKKKTENTKDKAFVFDEVQKAMEEDQHPLLKQLKKTGAQFI
jgi:hypothetical protein